MKELKKRNQEERKKPTFEKDLETFRSSLKEVFDYAGRDALEKKENESVAAFIEDQVSIVA